MRTLSVVRLVPAIKGGVSNNVTDDPELQLQHIDAPFKISLNRIEIPTRFEEVPTFATLHCINPILLTVASLLFDHDEITTSNLLACTV